MHQGKLVFAQFIAHLPLSTLRRCVAAHRGKYKVLNFSCLNEFLVMAVAQLTARKSLRSNAAWAVPRSSNLSRQFSSHTACPLSGIALSVGATELASGLRDHDLIESSALSDASGAPDLSRS